MSREIIPNPVRQNTLDLPTMQRVVAQLSIILTRLSDSIDFLRSDAEAGGGGGGGATDLSYVPGTRTIESSTGADTTLPIVGAGAAGLAPATGGGTVNFLRADATFALPPGNATTILIVENRTSDPGSPSTGQIWLRTDL